MHHLFCGTLHASAEVTVECLGETFPSDAAGRKPFRALLARGKTDVLYKAHAYHTKVPHLAIVPSIQHHTAPGELVLDGFARAGRQLLTWYDNAAMRSEPGAGDW